MQERVTFDEWKRLNIRVAKIIDVTDHPNADRLYVLKVDLGNEQRQIVAGIKQHYTKEQLLGKIIVMLTNLEPAVIRGIKSDGMLLAAMNKNKTEVVLLTTDKEVPPGSNVE